MSSIVFSQVYDKESTRQKPLWNEEFQEEVVSPDQPWVYLPQNQRWVETFLQSFTAGITFFSTRSFNSNMNFMQFCVKNLFPFVFF